MPLVSHFQRYSQRENHATNNTLLLLRYFYQYSPFKLQKVLRELLEDANLTIGLEFEQQVREELGVPDARILQNPLRIYIETKLWSTLDPYQIQRHLESISIDGSERCANPILIGLTQSAVAEESVQQFSALANAKGVSFTALTFTQLADKLRDHCADHEDDLIAMVEDYRDYLSQEGLLDMNKRWLLVVPCGTSNKENVKYGLYYEPSVRPYKRGYGFLGIYHDKCITHVGGIEAIVLAKWNDGEVSFVQQSGRITDDHKIRIRHVIDQTQYYNLKAEQLRFYLVDQFHETESKKSSRNGIWGTRAFELSRAFGLDVGRRNYTSSDLAADLSGKTWN